MASTNSTRSDHALIWAIHGGEQRYATGLADALVEDDTPQIAERSGVSSRKGVPPVHRSSQVELYRSRIEAWIPRGSGTRRSFARFGKRRVLRRKNDERIYRRSGNRLVPRAYGTGITYAW